MIAVDHIVRELLIAGGKEANGPYYPLYLQLALTTIRELQNDFQVAGEETYQVINIDTEKRCAPLPDNYVEWKSCGYLCGTEYTRMYHNSQLMAFWLKDDCGNDITTNTCCNNVYESWWGLSGFWGVYGNPVYDVYWDGRLYGLGGGSQNGGFAIDKSKGLILFDRQADLSGSKPIVLVYSPSGINPTGNTAIDNYAADALKHGIRYQLALNANNPKQGEIVLREQLYEKAKKLAKYRIYSISIAEVADRIRQGTKSTPTF